MNSIKRELKAVIENQKNFIDEISVIKARLEALENKKDNNAEVQIDNLFEGIQLQRYVIQDKLSKIDDSIKKIDEELEALTTKVFETTEVGYNADADNAQKSEISCMQEYDMKKHVKANHGKSYEKKCIVCGKSFLENHELETHLKTHKEIQPFSCDMCEKKFYLKWRLEKHRSGHYTNTFCHYFNNQKLCPYEDIGCKFLHEVSSCCRYSTCNNILCQYRHVENDLVTEDMIGVDDDSEILQTSTPMKYYPDCEDCSDNSNCVKCIIRNIRETDDSYST